MVILYDNLEGYTCIHCLTKESVPCEVVFPILMHHSICLDFTSSESLGVCKLCQLLCYYFWNSAGNCVNKGVRLFKDSFKNSTRGANKSHTSHAPGVKYPYGIILWKKAGDSFTEHAHYQ